MNAWELAKKHPLLVGGGAIIIIGGAVLFFGSGGNDDGAVLTMTTPPQDPNQVAAGQQLQAMNLALQAQQAETAAAKEVRLAEIAADSAKATLEAKTAFDANKLVVQNQAKAAYRATTTQRIKQRQEFILKRLQLLKAKEIAVIQAKAFGKKVA